MKLEVETHLRANADFKQPLFQSQLKSESNWNDTSRPEWRLVKQDRL